MAVYWQQRRWHLLKAITSIALCWLCALLLVLAPSLGQIHRTLHSGAWVLSATPLPPHPEAAEGGLHRLFATHGPTDCLLLDQGTWAGPNTCLLPLPPLPPAAQPTPAHYSHTAATRTAAFQARAPPPILGLV